MSCTSEGTSCEGTAKQMTPDDIVKIMKGIDIEVSMYIQFFASFTYSSALLWSQLNLEKNYKIFENEEEKGRRKKSTSSLFAI